MIDVFSKYIASVGVKFALGNKILYKIQSVEVFYDSQRAMLYSGAFFMTDKSVTRVST